MVHVLIYWFIASLVLMLVSTVLPGVEIAGLGTAMVATLVMGLVNMAVRPVLDFLTLPINFLTLGLFSFVVNAGMFALSAWLVPGFEVSNFWSALFGSLLMAVCTGLLANILSAQTPHPKH